MAQQSLGMHLRADQRMLMAPRMLQSIELLQVPVGELEAWLSVPAETNEALLVEPPQGESTPPLGRRGSRADTDAHDEMLRNQPARTESLHELVEQQLAGLEASETTLAWVRFLVTQLDPAGFLSGSDEQLLAAGAAAGLPGGASELGTALATLQGLEPIGLGARDAIEALLLQLDPDSPDYTLLCRLLEEFLEELAKNRLPRVARALELDLDDLQRLLSVLRDLDPRPVASLVEVSAPVIVPDVMVTPGDGGFDVALTRGVLPEVRVDPDIAKLVGDRDNSKEVRGYLRDKIDQARWIVEAVSQRGETLLRVASYAFSRQHAFLRHGPGHLVPLTMMEAAEALGLHVSTVSRAVAGKYAQTPFGILSLRALFQASASEGGRAGEAVAQDSLRETIREVFEREDKTCPLSDDQVVEELAARGIQIARRTVAKYRGELGIPSSYRRKVHGAA